MRPITLPREFEKLTEEQLSQVNQWLEHHSYKDVRQKLEETFHIEITTDKLHRYFKKIEILNDLNEDLEDAKFSVHEFYDLLNGREVSTATSHLIDLRMFKLAMEPSKSVSRLVNLHRLATYKERHDYAKQRLDLDNRMLALKERRLENTLKMRAHENGRAGRQSQSPAPSFEPPSFQVSAAPQSSAAPKLARTFDTCAWLVHALSQRFSAVPVSHSVGATPQPNVIHFPSPLE